MYDDQNKDLFDDFSGSESQSNWNQSGKVRSLADSAFSKGLAATIICGFPVASIIAIFLGLASGKAAKQAESLARQSGCSAGGKNVAAKVLGKVGLISGIVLTLFYAFYIGVLFFAALLGAL